MLFLQSTSRRAIFYAIFKQVMQSRIAVFWWRSPAVHSLFTHFLGKYFETQGMCLRLLNTFSAHLWLHIHTSFHFFLCTHTLKPVSDQHCSVQHDTLTGSPPEGEAVMRNYWYKMVREFQNTHTRKRPLKHPPAPLTSALCLYGLCGG